MTLVRVTFKDVGNLIDQEDLKILEKRGGKGYYAWPYLSHMYDELYASYLKMKYPEIVTLHG